jgi:spectinomycin phosphotransferase
MKEPPADLVTAELVHTLRVYWGLEVSQLDYLAVGFGAHHWQATTPTGARYFLALHELGHAGNTVDDRTLARAQLQKALGAARWLETSAELDFVVGPVPDVWSMCCRPVSERFALALYPWLECAPMRHPDDPETAHVLARLHAVAPRLPPGLGRTEDFRIPHRAQLEDALMDLGQTRHTGPYAERARDLLRIHRDGLRALFDFYDAEAAHARGSSPGWVITHGELFGPNLLRCAVDGSLKLVDWDSLLIAPRERDLWELPRDGPAWIAYGELLHAPIEERLLRLYRAWYDLAETSVYVALFRSPHVADQNAATSWDNFLVYLPTRERWPGVVT